MPRSFPSLDVEIEEITARELKRRLDDGETLTLIDTREPEEFEEWQISHPNLTVRNIPFAKFLDESGENPAQEVPEGIPDGPLVTSCAIGISSFYVAEFLVREGYEAVALEDGMEGWAELNERRVLDLDGDQRVIQFHRPSSGCLAYMLVSGDEAAVVDPLRAFASEYGGIAEEYGATLRYAIDTHVHADHVSGVREVATASDVAVVLPEGATDRGLAYDATLVEDGEEIPLGEHAIIARALPGHTTEMMGYHFDDVLLTGDSLFLDSVARPDLEDPEQARNAAETLYETLQGLDDVPDGTVVAPGHVGPTTAPAGDGTFTATLGEIRQRLGVFEEPKDAFLDRVVEDLPPRPTNYETIIEINLGRETADDSEAFELELGPNNCAVGE